MGNEGAFRLDKPLSSNQLPPNWLFGVWLRELPERRLLTSKAGLRRLGMGLLGYFKPNFLVMIIGASLGAFIC